MTVSIAAVPVRRSIVVEVPVDDAFDVFTSEIGSWWPATHHIGASPMTGMAIEPRVDGRCFSTHEDGAECEFGTVLAWEPPHRLVFTWQITPQWKFEPDRARASEVEVRFHALSGGGTRVDLEHRFLDRHEGGGESMHAAVDGAGGWTMVLARFTERAARRGDPPAARGAAASPD
jgi:uncharacterized protein YndB with AHSA1/START domain